MPINVAAVQIFSDGDLLILYRNALAQLAISEETSVNGHTVRRSSIPYIRSQIEWLENRIQLAGSSNGGNVALTSFGDIDISNSSAPQNP